MSNANEPAFPGKMNVRGDDVFFTGLTKREYFAALAMQGVLHGYEVGGPVGDESEFISFVVRASVLAADALIAELEKQP